MQRYSALAYGVIYGVNKNNEGYLSQNDNIVVATIVTWGSWFLGFSSFIPIGLLVTVELVKLGQGKLLAKDELCCSRGQYAEVLTSNLNEELGQIEYIMTDKTGTLTTN
jgi:P-type E1-E2 ATPase